MNCWTNCFSSIQDTPTIESPPPPSTQTDSLQPNRQTNMNHYHTSQKLIELRSLLIDRKLEFYIVPSTDAHASEYLAPSDQRREYLTNFTGSAGTAIIGLESAWLFTDSRYWIQAEEQLDQTSWQLMKVGTKGIPDWNDWLTSKDVPSNSRIGIDPMLISHTAAERLKNALQHRQSYLVYPIENLIDSIWGSLRPNPLPTPIVLHPLRYAGRTTEDKLKELRSHISQRRATGYLISSLSELCWLLNIRGSDVPYNPFPFAYFYLSVNTQTDQSASSSNVLFLKSPTEQVSTDLRSALEELSIELASYSNVGNYLASIRTGPVLVDSSLSQGLVSKLVEPMLADSPSFITRAKAVKNRAEWEGFRQAYLRDGLAWCRWAAWLEDRIVNKDEEIDEWQAGLAFDRIRAQDPMFKGLAYANISATNENAALPHYEPTPEQHRVIDRETMYLNDSGAHYLDGTTDTTRTVFFGSQPTQKQKLAYTVVLQGHIAVATAIFPGGGDAATLTITQTTGSQLDALARQPGWRYGLLYGHGTGHGVGSFSSVHEGPHGIGTSNRAVDIPLKIGHTFTVEPGHYDFDERIGVRIESFYGVREHVFEEEGRGMKGSKWLSLERFTQVPISKDLIDWEILNEKEKHWIESHNEECKRNLMKLFNRECEEDQMAIEWLMRQ